ncbi:MAG: tetratricopeptide repeat protein, partial [Candidatus Hodarchaeales archaeon]
MISTQLRELFDKKQYQELIEHLGQMEDKRELTKLPFEEQAICIYYKSRALDLLGKSEEGLRESSKAYSELAIEGKLPCFILLIAQSHILLRMGRLDEALTISSKGDPIIQSLKTTEQNEVRWIAQFYNVKGFILHQKGQLDSALDYYTRTLSLEEMIDDPQTIATSLFSIGRVYVGKGELEKALDYCQRSLKLNEIYGDSDDIIWSTNTIARLYRDKGVLDIALDYYKRSLRLSESQDNKWAIAWTLFGMVRIFRDRGEVDKALDYSL